MENWQGRQPSRYYSHFIIVIISIARSFVVPLVSYFLPHEMCEHLCQMTKQHLACQIDGGVGRQISTYTVYKAHLKKKTYFYQIQTEKETFLHQHPPC